MFTEKDYMAFFKDLQNAENQMIANADEILSAVSDSDVRETLSSIREDEFRHLHLEDELFMILESQSSKV